MSDTDPAVAGHRATKNPRRKTGVSFEAPGSVLLLHGECQTTIGAGAFHFRVRDGIGWDHTAMAARESVRCAQTCASSAWGRDVTVSCSVGASMFRRGGEASWGYMVKPHGSLVRVSSMHCCTSTPRLSTSWSSRVLQGACAPGDLILVRASRLDAFSGYRFRT